MNYIKEMNALYDRQEQSPISGSAIALWSALMNINNKTRWKNTFTSPASVLRVKAGLTESSFKRARAELVRVGYIAVESQGRGKAPIYTMHSLVVESDEEAMDYCVFADRLEGNKLEAEREEAVEVSSVAAVLDEGMGDSFIEEGSREMDPVAREQVTEAKDQVADHPPAQQVNQEVTYVPTHHVNHYPDHLPNHDAAPLYKQYITKQNQNNTNASAADAREHIFSGTENKQTRQEQDAIKFYQENFGMASPFVAESLMDWIDSLGEALVIEAMKRALERNKTSWAYVKSILHAWYKKGIRTVEQAKAEQVAFENERKEKRGQHQAFVVAKEDIVPDWYEAEKERIRKKQVQEEVRSPEEMERNRERVEEMLRGFGAVSG